MPERPPAPNPAPPPQDDCIEYRVAMSRWAGVPYFTCGHRRVPVSTYLGMLTDIQVLHETTLGGTATERGLAADELASRHRQCRACEAQAKRNRRHWAALAVVAVVVLLVGWRCW